MKILDIWTKSNTFPPAILARLQAILKGTAVETAAPSKAPESSNKPCTFAKYTTYSHPAPSVLNWRAASLFVQSD